MSGRQMVLAPFGKLSMPSMVIRLLLFVVAVATLSVSVAYGQAAGTISLPWAVLADGKRLAAGTYQIRVTSERPQTPVGQSPDAQQWMEFVLNGQVVGRELAIVLREDDLEASERGPWPSSGGVRVDVLRGDDYARVWIRRQNEHYLIHLPRVR